MSSTGAAEHRRHSGGSRPRRQQQQEGPLGGPSYRVCVDGCRCRASCGCGLTIEPMKPGVTSAPLTAAEAAAGGDKEWRPGGRCPGGGLNVQDRGPGTGCTGEGRGVPDVCTGGRPGRCLRRQWQREARPCTQLGSKQQRQGLEGRRCQPRTRLQPLLLLPVLWLLLLLGGGSGGGFGPAGAAAQSCSGGVWTGGGSGPLYECSSQLISYGASTATSPTSAVAAAAGGLAGPPAITGNCLSGDPTTASVQATTWFTGNNGVSSCNVTVG